MGLSTGRRARDETRLYMNHTIDRNHTNYRNDMVA